MAFTTEIFKDFLYDLCIFSGEMKTAALRAAVWGAFF
jgi:hypothetical protein